MLRAQQDAPPVAPVVHPAVASGAGLSTKELTAATPALDKPVVEKLPAPKVAAAPPAATGKTQVQIAALASEESARTEWQRLSKSMPDLFGNRQPAVSKTEHDGHVLWRLRTGGFADIAQATAFCERVRAKRTGCSIASF
jgi:hypothetical protein